MCYCVELYMESDWVEGGNSRVVRFGGRGTFFSFFMRSFSPCFFLCGGRREGRKATNIRQNSVNSLPPTCASDKEKIPPTAGAKVLFFFPPSPLSLAKKFPPTEASFNGVYGRKIGVRHNFLFARTLREYFFFKRKRPFFFHNHEKVEG